MVKSLVAPLAVLAVVLLVAAPAAADPPSSPPGQDPNGPPGHDPNGPPGQQPDEPEGGDGNATGEGNGTASRSAEPAGTGAQRVGYCPLVRSNVGDPRVPKEQWVIIDPTGCVRETVERAIGGTLKTVRQKVPLL